MCGFYFSNFNLVESEVKRRLGRAKFRGPDYSGVLVYGRFSFGHNRLSIVDLDGRSNQPFCYSDYILVYNGEIFNYKEIRQELVEFGYKFLTESDTEVICAAYIEWGVNCVNRFVGMFAFVLLDKNTSEIFAARDRLGVKPFYYSFDDGLLEIASQISMLSSNKNVDDDSVNLYLKYGYVPTPKSIFKGVCKLEAGSFFVFREGDLELKIKSYWSINSPVENDQSLEAQANGECWQNLIEEAVKIRMNADVKVGTFLSSGVDSSVISKLASVYSNKLYSTFTVGFDVHEFDESKAAKDISNEIGLKNICLEFNSQSLANELIPFFNAFDEPFSDLAALPSLALAKHFKEHMTVALTGDGGDELFLGYKNYKYLKVIEKIFGLPIFLKGILNVLFSLLWVVLPTKKLSYIRGILSQRNLNDLAISFFSNFGVINSAQREHAERSGIYDLLNRCPSLLEKIASLNIHMWLESNNNVKTDRSSMYYGVELRSPFLDHRLYDYWKKLDVVALYDSGKKTILRSILGHATLHNLVSAKKRGFGVPIDKWMRSYFGEKIFEILKRKDIFKQIGLNVFWFKYVFLLHRLGLINRGDWIWRRYVLIKWYETYCYKEGSNSQYHR